MSDLACGLWSMKISSYQVGVNGGEVEGFEESALGVPRQPWRRVTPNRDWSRVWSPKGSRGRTKVSSEHTFLCYCLIQHGHHEQSYF